LNKARNEFQVQTYEFREHGDNIDIYAEGIKVSFVFFLGAVLDLESYPELPQETQDILAGLQEAADREEDMWEYA